MLRQTDVHDQTIDPTTGYTVEIRTWLDDKPVDELLGARQRKLIMKLNAPAEFTFILDGYSREAAALQELIYDLVLYREQEPIFRGRLGTSQDDVGPTGHVVPFSCVDYLGLLDRRHILVPTRYDQWSQSDIAWHMVNTTQSQPWGNLGIIRGLNPPSQPARDRSYDPGKKIGEAISQLGAVIGGFDHDVDAQRRFNVYYPEKGEDTHAVLDFGTHIRRITRRWVANDFMNVCVGTGAEGTEPYVAEARDLGRFPQGRIEGQFSDEDISVRSTLMQYTQGRLEAGLDPTGEYECELQPGVYDPRSMVLGNAYQLRVRSGRLFFERSLRILEVDLSLNDDGSQTVTLVMGKVARKLEEAFRQTDVRLERLERRAQTQTFMNATATAVIGGPPPPEGGGGPPLPGQRAVTVSDQVDIGRLPDGQYGLRVNGTLQAPRGIDYQSGGYSARRIFFVTPPTNPQTGDVLLVPR